MARNKFVQELGPQGIVNALKGQTNEDVATVDDLQTGRVSKIWITFSDPAVLELEATVVDDEPALLARLHYRRDEASPL